MKLIHRNVNEQDYKNLVLCEGVNIPSHPQKTFEMFKNLMIQINEFKDVVIDTTIPKSKTISKYDVLMKSVIKFKNYALVMDKRTNIIYLYNTFHNQKYDYHVIPHYKTLQAISDKINTDFFNNLKMKLRKLKDLYFYFGNSNNNIVLYEKLKYYDNNIKLIIPIEINRCCHSFTDMYLRYQIYYPYSKTYFSSTETVNLHRPSSMFFNMNICGNNMIDTVLDENFQKEIIFMKDKSQKAKDFMKEQIKNF